MTHDPRPPVWLLDLGRVEYGAAYQLQRRLLEERDAGRVPDLLLLVEHPPVITLGRRGSRDDILVGRDALDAEGIAVHETNRGGLVTYHGPGQIVGYPIGKLRELAGDAPTYVWRLEEMISRALADWGIVARRDAANRGVFAGEGLLSGKIAAIGVAVSKSITMHGFALNVSPNLDHFGLIDPCGIGDLGVTSMQRLLGSAPPLDAVQVSLVRRFAEVFDRAVQPAPEALWSLISRWDMLETIGAGKSE
ncbi:MAG: lipoyl(octanoyl) transferase LipB [Chloroflexi bacterium]|nr:lipoyl(octanoyl) transferase LipB [Chloroflexota bacterium]